VRLARFSIPCLRRFARFEEVTVTVRPRRFAKQLAATPGAIGMMAMAAVDEMRGRVRWVSIDGIAPSAGNVASGRYPMVRETVFVTWSPPPPAVARLLEFVRSGEGERVIRVNSAIPAK
jgi:phosphate transport system substrate-binding protein